MIEEPLDIEDELAARREALAPKGEDGRRVVQVDDALHDMRDVAEEELGKLGTVYQKMGLLVEVDQKTAEVRTVRRGHLRALLTQTICWEAYDERTRRQRRSFAPEPVVAAVLERGGWPKIPRLRALISQPTFRPDGSLIEVPGYDVTTSLYYAPACEFPPIPANPSRKQAHESRDRLLRIYDDFPFEHDTADAARSACLAIIFTLLTRRMHDSPTPLFAADGNCPGTGKGLLIEVTHEIATGAYPKVTSLGTTEEETGKRLTGLGASGQESVRFDNITGKFGNAELDKALTSTTYQGRILGQSGAESMPDVWLLITWLATGNNIQIGGDLRRRLIRIMLVTREDHPDQRENFKIKDLRGHVKKHRLLLWADAMTCLRYAFQNKNPSARLRPMGSFETWSDIVRRALLALELPDPIESNGDIAEADENAALLPLLIEGWEEVCTDFGGPCPAGEALRRLKERSQGRWVYQLPRLRAAVGQFCGDLDKLSSVGLGRKLAEFLRRPCAGKRLNKDSTNKLRPWFVEPVAQIVE